MSQLEIPLLRESAAFAARLIEASRRFDDVKYKFHRRINWTQRYDEKFYELEADCFQADPEAYLAQQTRAAPKVSDVFAQKLRTKQVVTVLMKVAAHWFFGLLGSFANRGIRLSDASIYRKCYVDDIELVFDPDETGVVRAVYPFPLNAGRQWRYLGFLRDKGYIFKLTGNPYLVKDLMRFLVLRNVSALQRMESRAQVLHACQVAAHGIKTVQLSDEFDIGSLDFARTLSRLSVLVINSAHGVGKYFPVHAYSIFNVLTRRQKEYYHAVRSCSYLFRSLNVIDSPQIYQSAPIDTGLVTIVCLGQTSAFTGKVINDAENYLINNLYQEFSDKPRINLFYKNHPSRSNVKLLEGFGNWPKSGQPSGIGVVLFVSLFSSAQIDPNFKGRKILVRAKLIYPEIAFDENTEILTFTELAEEIYKELSASSPNN
jgi:hypothetical protein